MYLPFVATTGRPKMGLKPLPLDAWIDIDEAFVIERSLKTALLTHYHEAVFAELMGAIAALSPEMQIYKSLLPFRQALIGYLHSRVSHGATVAV